MPQDSSRRSLWVRGLEVVAVLVFSVVWLATAARSAWAAPAETLLWAAVLLLPAILLADFAAGCVHWFADTFFSENSALIGPIFIQPFREHHRDPSAMARHTAIEVMGNACMLLVPLAVLLALVPLRTPAARGLVVAALLLLLSLAVTNLFHRWAHSSRVPAAVEWLQRRRWILSPAVHGLHHRGGFDRSFCVTTGWLNPWLDRIGFFPRLEHALRSTGLAKAVAED